MKIMTYNIMEGGLVKNDPIDGKPRFDRVLDVIAKENADVLGIQETHLTTDEDNKLVHALQHAGIYRDWMIFADFGQHPMSLVRPLYSDSSIPKVDIDNDVFAHFRKIGFMLL